jgi:hypothetical protein
LPAIVITGHVDPVLEREASQAGAAHSRKPIEVKALLQILKDKLRVH